LQAIYVILFLSRQTSRWDKVSNEGAREILCD